jgi:DNA-binding LacI/PurR family transcriptional regulator
MAIAGLGMAGELGFDVPGELSIVAYEDSPLCQVVGPALTALKRDIPGFGMRAAQLLFDGLADRGRPGVQAETPHLVVRGSTAAPA